MSLRSSPKQYIQHVVERCQLATSLREVIVATPGRLLDHLQGGTARLDQVEVLAADPTREQLRAALDQFRFGVPAKSGRSNCEFLIVDGLISFLSRSGICIKKSQFFASASRKASSPNFLSTASATCVATKAKASLSLSLRRRRSPQPVHKPGFFSFKKRIFGSLQHFTGYQQWFARMKNLRN